MPERIKLGDARPPQGNFDLFENVDNRTYFADGVALTTLGAAVTKISIYEIPVTMPPAGMSGSLSVSGGVGSPPETRTITLTIAMPTRAVLEFCVRTLQTLKDNDVLALFEKDLANSRNVIDSIQTRK